ncbi:MAG: pyruvoyl-dependent arginine decarboxylase [Blastocatellia bacterium]
MFMRIYVTTGIGEAPTPLAAFDAALIDAGIPNYNLIYLSSVIPANCVVLRARYVTQADEYGFRLYIVMAQHQEQQQGKSAWAGLGWTQEQTSGRGLFVEIHGSERRQVESDIQATLESMIASRPLSYGAIESEIVGIECRDKPVCALAIAVYQSEGWEK